MPSKPPPLGLFAVEINFHFGLLHLTLNVDLSDSVEIDLFSGPTYNHGFVGFWLWFIGMEPRI